LHKEEIHTGWFRRSYCHLRISFLTTFWAKVSYKPGSHTQYLQSYVLIWKRTTVNCAWPSLT
jgi:hypothetical protein